MSTIKHRRATKSQWATLNPTLAAGELGLEIGVNGEPDRFKLGNGLSPWEQLKYFINETEIDIDVGRLSKESLDADYAPSSLSSLVETIEDLLNQGRLSEEELAATYVHSDLVTSGRLSEATLDAEYAPHTLVDLFQTLSQLISTGRLAKDQLDAAYANAEIVSSGRLSKVSLDSAYTPFKSLLIPGYYYSAYHTGGTTGTPSGPHNYVTASPFIPGRSTTLVRIGCNVSTAGSAGGVIRMAIYALDLTNLATTLLVDAGTVDASTTGPKELIIEVPVTANSPILLASALQGNPTTVPVVSKGNGRNPLVISSNLQLAANNALPAFSKSNISGAFPASLGALGVDGGVTNLVVRA